VVAGLPVDTFHWLLDHSIGFNRFVMNQLNERLGQFIAAREIDRMNNPDVRVARNLAALFNPVLYPAWAKCCASRSRNWPTWWACRASA
jgi:CRP/FNR family cyclic AMP-dependent transcriptional regulator